MQIFEEAIIYNSKKELIEIQVSGISSAYLYAVMSASRNVDSLAALASGVFVLLRETLPDSDDDHQFALGVMSMGLVMAISHFCRDILLFMHKK
jgi:hypothetical protein